MSHDQHAQAIALWQAICREAGCEAPFAVVVLVALEWMLTEIRDEHARLREPETVPGRRYA